jgi:hypothetical protein
MWDFGHRHKIRDLVIIVLIILVVTNVFREWGFPWWMFFFVWPVFSGWRGQQERHEKQKREPRVYDAEEPQYQKPKREPRYALGDDGELIELPAEDHDEPQKRRYNDYV